MTSPAVSIVVPCHNAASTIADCVESLKAQRTRTPFEIIVVDNASTDNTLQILRRVDGIQTFSEVTPGSYAARNLGISNAKGDIVAFTDADCIPQPDWLDKLTAPLTNSDVHVTVGHTEFAGASPTLSLLQEYTHNRRLLIFQSDDAEIYFGYTNNLVTRMSTLQQVGLFENRKRGGDTIFVRKCVDAFGTDSVVYAGTASVRHMEVSSVGKYVAKRFIYGWSSILYSRVIGTRAHSGAKWPVAFSATVDSCDANLTDRIRLLSALAASTAAWNLGRIRGRFGSKGGPS